MALLWSEYAFEYHRHQLCLLVSILRNTFSRVIGCALRGDINCLVAHWPVILLAAVAITATIGFAIAAQFLCRRWRAKRVAPPSDERPATKVD